MDDKQTQDSNDDGGGQATILNVWQDGLEAAFDRINVIIDEFPYVAMDTEFPGVVARPIGSFKNSKKYHYQTLKCNVDLLKIIQLGLTFFDKHGNRPNGVCTYQFNFNFDLDHDMFADDSIEMLRNCGLDFDRHKTDGIDATDFAACLYPSGLVLSEDVNWITFHAGYDMGYFLKLLVAKPLPAEEKTFFRQLKLYFPVIYDIKFIMHQQSNFRASLSRLAEELQVIRSGAKHQAGSDSWVTGDVFFAMLLKFFSHKDPEEEGQVKEKHEAATKASDEKQSKPTEAVTGLQLAQSRMQQYNGLLYNLDNQKGD